MRNFVSKLAERTGELLAHTRLLARTQVSAGAVLIAGCVLSLILATVAGSSIGAGIALALTLAWVAAVLLRPGAPAAAEADREDSGSAQAPARDGMLQALLSALPDGAMALDREGTIVSANGTAAALFPSAVGRHIALVMREPELVTAIEDVCATGTGRDLQCRLPPPVEQTLAVRVAPLGLAAPGMGASTIVLLRDVSEQEKLSRMRVDFVANASHELRTPLASLKGFIETLQGAAKDDPKAREQFLGIMHEQASRMARLIDDLLSLSRIEMREHVPPRGSADLATIIDDVGKALGPLAEAGSIRIGMREIARPALVTGDKDELTQVVHNLVQNAIKYGRAGGKVDISLLREAGRLVLRVADDGIGIAPEHLPRLTERFYRVNAKESRERGGTGLGLSIVKHIVNRHRGQLHVESQRGAGSTFIVSLSATQQASQQ